MDTPPYNIVNWEDAPDHPFQPYVCQDVDGNVVKIQPKNPANHTPGGHPLVNDSGLFHNLRIVVSEPDDTQPSTSNGQRAIENRQKGNIVVYSKDNFIGQLDIPGMGQGIVNDRVEVVMLYPHDAGETPYSLTYNIKAIT